MIRQLTITASELKSNWVVNVSVKFSLLFFVGSLALLLFRWPVLPPAVPLWYSKPWGMEQLAHPAWLFLLPFGSLFWYALDLTIVAWQGNRYRIFTQALFLTTFLVSFLSFLTLVKILFLIT
ncbi:hypothetical protein HYV22_02230 [Candidatus Gottesmanbacteria bacterium]|nr:hypothetical protein [Candidatus Gottesmanbacteria bacterium]